MKTLISGSTGLVGKALVQALKDGGDEVMRLVRRTPRSEHEIQWDPVSGALDPGARLEGVEAVVHLAGENIGGKRWSARQKRELRASRIDATQSLVASLRAQGVEPDVFVCASAVGYYGDRGEELLDESSAKGSGFLADLCDEWERAGAAFEGGRTRVVWARFGVILSPHGGALAKMLLPFRLGLGGRIGSGRQYMSWISASDAVRALEHILRESSLRGVVNVVAPVAVTNAEFTRCLGRVLARPALLPMPAFAARLALGEMAQELLLAGARVQPRALEASGFRYEQPELGAALRHELQR